MIRGIGKRGDNVSFLLDVDALLDLQPKPVGAEGPSANA
jgi:hypothetical protein